MIFSIRDDHRFVIDYGGGLVCKVVVVKDYLLDWEKGTPCQVS